MPAPETYLSPEEAGVFLGGPARPVKPKTLRNWRSMGTGPPYTKVARRIQYPESGLRKYLQTHTVRTTAS